MKRFLSLLLLAALAIAPARAQVVIDWADVSKTGSSIADLTTRSASDLSSGTLPDARFPATLPALSGVNLTALNASNLGSGTIPDARFPATLPALNGSALTALNASNISSGTLAAARLPTTITQATTFATSAGNTALTITPFIGGILIDSGATSNGTYPALRITSSGSGWGSGIQLRNTAASGRNYGIYAGSGGPLSFTDETALVEWMTVTGAAIGSGNVAIKYTTPSASTASGALTVAGGLAVAERINAGGRIDSTHSTSSGTSSAFSNTNSGGYGILSRGGSTLGSTQYVARFANFADVAAFTLYSDAAVFARDLAIGNTTDAGTLTINSGNISTLSLKDGGGSPQEWQLRTSGNTFSIVDATSAVTPLSFAPVTGVATFGGEVNLRSASAGGSTLNFYSDTTQYWRMYMNSADSVLRLRDMVNGFTAVEFNTTSTGAISFKSTTDATGVAATGAIQSSGGLLAAKSIVAGTGFYRYKSANGSTASPVEDRLLAWTNTNGLLNGAGIYALNSLTDNSAVWLALKTLTTAGTATTALTIDASQFTNIGSSGTATSRLTVSDNYRDITSGVSTAALTSLDSFAINKGGSLQFNGAYTGTTITSFGGIKGSKENATDGNTAGQLQFYTRPAGGAMTLALTIASTRDATFAGAITTTNSLSFTTDSQGAVLSTTGSNIYLDSAAGDIIMRPKNGTNNVRIQNGASLFVASAVTTGAPTGGSAAAWKLGEETTIGTADVGLRVQVGSSTYLIAADKL
ncbi:MAG TPA: hypothetical protein VGD88_06030 [Opitutaceae bacterium]